jgi:3-methyladenine DNA glycosylase/8-oxoguanine DNA glycosylase
MRLTCNAFHFTRLVQSHGWRHLAPFEWDAEKEILTRPLHLQNGASIDVALRYVSTQRGGRIDVRTSGRAIPVEGALPKSSIIDFRPSPRPSPEGRGGRRQPRSANASAEDVEERAGLRSQIRRMLCLNEDFTPFHALCESDSLLRFAHDERCGGMLRCPTAFEDVVKTVCTTNCDWRNTKLMCAQLCALGGGNFPTPRQILAIKESKLKAKTALGYRTRSVRAIATEVSEGRLPLDEWSARGEFDLARERLKSIWGIGKYSVNHILILLGDYRHIPVDSEVLRYLRNTHFQKRNVSEKEAVEPYSRFGNYRYLAFKFGRIARAMNYVNK